MSKPSWLEYKQGLGFDFPNLPYYQVLHVIIIVNQYVKVAEDLKNLCFFL